MVLSLLGQQGKPPTFSIGGITMESNFNNFELPFAMRNLDDLTPQERGYLPDEIEKKYIPSTQTSNIPWWAMKTYPTTYSRIITTGVITDDVDEGRDDSGTD